MRAGDRRKDYLPEQAELPSTGVNASDGHPSEMRPYLTPVSPALRRLARTGIDADGRALLKRYAESRRNPGMGTRAARPRVHATALFAPGA